MTYELKRTDFFGRNTAVILQNENGPCPLIAIGNILLLRGLIKIHEDYARITYSDLISLIADYLMTHPPKLESESMKKDYEHNVNEAISILPKMQFGLDVNVRYKNIKDFEFTPEMIIFDLLDIDLVHGWLPDPQEKETFELMSTLSYNQVQEKLIELAVITSESEKNAPKPQPDPSSPSSPPPPPSQKETEEKPKEISSSPSPKLEEKFSSSPSKRLTTFPSRSSPILPSKSAIEEKKNQIKPEDHEKILLEGNVIEQFLAKSASQLTYHGLVELHRQIKENRLSVFFRNNHFCTLFKYQAELYVLITDAGYRHRPVVWEKLNEVDNDTILCKSNFKVYQTAEDYQILEEDHGADYDESLEEQLRIEKSIQAQKKKEEEERDLQLALELHEEQLRESQKLNAPKQQEPAKPKQEPVKPKQEPAQTKPPAKSSTTAPPKPPKDPKKDSCNLQ